MASGPSGEVVAASSPATGTASSASGMTFPATFSIPNRWPDERYKNCWTVKYGNYGNCNSLSSLSIETINKQVIKFTNFKFLHSFRS